MTKLAITGAAGRMGRRIAALALEHDGLELVAATEAPGAEAIGRDVGELAGAGPCGVAVSDHLETDADAVIDFSLPEGTGAVLPICRERKIAMVIGTTGLDDAQLDAVADAAEDIPLIHASNYSVGVNLLLKILGPVAEALGPAYDIEIAETHHRFKKDAPSGTALSLAEAICNALGKDPAKALTHGRAGHQPRQRGEIGMHALRVGDTVGEHQVHFGNLGETITIAHSAHTRDTFVRGALRAALWLAGREPGRYTMADVLGL